MPRPDRVRTTTCTGDEPKRSSTSARCAPVATAPRRSAARAEPPRPQRVQRRVGRAGRLEVDRVDRVHKAQRGSSQPAQRSPSRRDSQTTTTGARHPAPAVDHVLELTPVSAPKPSTTPATEPRSSYRDRRGGHVPVRVTGDHRESDDRPGGGIRDRGVSSAGSGLAGVGGGASHAQRRLAPASDRTGCASGLDRPRGHGPRTRHGVGRAGGGSGRGSAAAVRVRRARRRAAICRARARVASA